MDITLKKATFKQPHKFRRMAAEAVKARLYVPGWELMPTLYNFYERLEHWRTIIGKKDVIVIAYYGDVPVGVCLLDSKSMSMTFVRKRHRRQKIGTKMIKKALGTRKRFTYGRGTVSTVGFFKTFPGAKMDDYWW